MIASSVGTHGLSMWALFLQADWIVKAVIISLIVASIWSWGIVFSKIKRIMRLNRLAYGVTSSFSDTMLDSMEMRFSDHCPFVHLLFIASKEWRRMKVMPSIDQRQMGLQRLEQLMSVQIDQQKEELSEQMSILASIGSTAPFIGLFGTVWGIMNSFQSIASSQNTSLAVVAPGIAEALFATAIGLVVAIPAVAAYNRLTVSVQTYGVRMENFAQELLACCMRS